MSRAARALLALGALARRRPLARRPPFRPTSPEPRRLVPVEPCTGVAASWCPNCGDCECERDPETCEPIHVLVHEDGSIVDFGDSDFCMLSVTWTFQPGSPSRWVGDVLRRLGLRWERAGERDCPLHRATSRHATAEIGS